MYPQISNNSCKTNLECSSAQRAILIISNKYTQMAGDLDYQPIIYFSLFLRFGELTACDKVQH